MTRLRDQIKEPSPILIGLSFGGMVAIELCKQMEVKQLILISTVKSRRELPVYYRLAGLLRLNRLAPTFFFRKSSFITNWFFGAESEEDKRMLKEIMKSASPKYVRWAVNQVLNWKNEKVPGHYFHIHGTNDRILPMRNIHVNMPVKNGGHFMVLNRAKEISSILGKIMESKTVTEVRE